MKKMIVVFCAIAQLAYAQTEKIVKTTVQRALVFQKGAQLSSSENVYLDGGTTNIVFENVSPSLKVNSLQASGKGEFTIMDVRYRLKYAENNKAVSEDPQYLRLKEQLKALEDSLEEAEYAKKDVQNRITNLQTERTIVMNNKMMRGEFQRDSLPLFTQSLEFLRNRLNNIDAELLKLDKEFRIKNQNKEKLTVRLSSLKTILSNNYAANGAPTKPVPQVIVTVLSEKPKAALISISYYVAEAGWTPSYDLRASKESSSIEFRSHAGVFQNTGVDWKDVDITLSTGDPMEPNVKPNLNPYYLDYDRERVAYSPVNQNMLRNSPYGSAAKPLKEDKAQYDSISASNITQDFPDEYIQTLESMTRMEYEIKLKYNIESDNKPHNVVIQNKNINAVYTYSIIPKLDPDAFLIARITDWEGMNLIAATARVYSDGSFVGETFINPLNTNDTLQINLGRDKSIAATRVKVKDKSKEKIFSDQKFTTKTYEINVRNTKNIPIRIVLEDQAPVTKQTDIKIDYLESSGADFNTNSGKLIWDMTLKPKENKRLIFSYEVKYPKEKQISML